MRGIEAELQPFFEGHPTANTDQTGQGISAEGVAAAGDPESEGGSRSHQNSSLSPFFASA